MKVGQELKIVPTFDTTYGMTEDVLPMPATVVFVHPKRRFYRVKFTAKNGGSWTETFPCTPCERDLKVKKGRRAVC